MTDAHGNEQRGFWKEPWVCRFISVTSVLPLCGSLRITAWWSQAGGLARRTTRLQASMSSMLPGNAYILLLPHMFFHSVDLPADFLLGIPYFSIVRIVHGMRFGVAFVYVVQHMRVPWTLVLVNDVIGAFCSLRVGGRYSPSPPSRAAGARHFLLPHLQHGFLPHALMPPCGWRQWSDLGVLAFIPTSPAIFAPTPVYHEHCFLFYHHLGRMRGGHGGPLPFMTVGGRPRMLYCSCCLYILHFIYICSSSYKCVSGGASQ